MDNALTQAIHILEPLLLLLGAWAVAEAARWIRGHITHAYTREALLRLNDAVGIATKELAQTTVADLKVAAEDGKLSDAEVKEIKDKAYANARTYLGKNGVAALEKVFSTDELEKIILGKIEAEVHDLK